MLHCYIFVVQSIKTKSDGNGTKILLLFDGKIKTVCLNSLNDYLLV